MMDPLPPTPLTDEQRNMYRRLWALSNDATPPVFASYVHRSRIVGSAMFFLEPEQGVFCPGIWVGRERDRLPAECDQPDLEHTTLPDLITLAHERGHERSWRERTYVPSAICEERRAWRHAVDILDEMGFTDWDAFEKAKDFSLTVHRRHGTPECVSARDPSPLVFARRTRDYLLQLASISETFATHGDPRWRDVVTHLGHARDVLRALAKSERLRALGVTADDDDEQSETCYDDDDDDPVVG